MLNILNTNLSIIAGFLTLVGSLFAVLRYTNNYQKDNAIRNNLVKLKELFENTVSKLSSDNLSEKLAAAILLRRFFRDDTELGVGGTPLADETINTIAAVLRAEKTSDFQKLLADSLKHAPSLESSDLQKTNLSNSVLGKENLKLCDSDFYRADLSRASFKLKTFKEKDKDKDGKDIDGTENYDGVDLTGAQFYQTNLHKTNFSGAELLNTNFFEANLDGAIFKRAKNIPQNVQDNLIDGVYSLKCCKNNKIFISKPRIMNQTQEITYDYVISRLKKDFHLDVLEKIDDQISSVLPKIKDKVFNSSGMVIFSFKQYHIEQGKFRWWNESEIKEISNDFFTTPWIYVETGIATALKKPMLVISDFKMNDGIFTNGSSDDLIFLTNPDGDFKKEEFEITLKEWKQYIEE